MKTLTCENCKKQFVCKLFRKDRPRRFCGNKCKMLGLNKQGVHPCYKGGFVDAKGYRVVCINGTPVYEHRYIMEQYIGRKLRSGEIVHHKDHNPLNNSISNLQVTNRGFHNKLHVKTFRDAERKECTKCHKTKSRSEYHLRRGKNRDGHAMWCKSCVSIYHKNRH